MASSRCRSANILSTLVGNSVVAIVTDLWRHLSDNSKEDGIQCIPRFPRIINAMLAEIHKMKRCDFLNFCNAFSNSLILYQRLFLTVRSAIV